MSRTVFLAGAGGVIDAAAYAAVLAIDNGSPGVCNVAEASPHACIEKATRELGWDPSLRW